LNAQVNNSKDLEKNEGIKRNAMCNLEEIKVRWKKAALENCPGVLVWLLLPSPAVLPQRLTLMEIIIILY